MLLAGPHLEALRRYHRHGHPPRSACGSACAPCEQLAPARRHCSHARGLRPLRRLCWRRPIPGAWRSCQARAGRSCLRTRVVSVHILLLLAHTLGLCSMPWHRGSDKLRALSGSPKKDGLLAQFLPWAVRWVILSLFVSRAMERITVICWDY